MDRLTTTFSALADPTRRAILARLLDGPASINQLAEPFAMTLPTVSRHIKVLADAGLVEKEKAAQARFCRLAPDALALADDWLADYRRYFESRFDRLDAQLRAEASPKGDQS
ncbi:MAG: winged helix-turn-helix transcriptional regulator [Devosia sp.]|uniref:ArsR/SmtB family transcription factor n=1 Tax=Devosia sp. TaxID=1871048 RepID=UPI0024C5F44E|nr:metalloregulator ArsR/SmtB family transcription factor [Devosia sp.]UYN98968.1 MAG: winged helix-turn-helix transcriptional regulator [Devosia sp.]